MGGKEEEIIKEEEEGDTGEGKARQVGGKHGEEDECREGKRGADGTGRGGEIEEEGEGEESVDEEEETATNGDEDVEAEGDEGKVEHGE